MYAYVFLVGYDEDGPHCDSFLDVSSALGVTHDQYLRSIQAAERVGADSTSRKALLTSMSSINLRARVTGKRMYKLTTEEPITIEELDSVLRIKQLGSNLKPFLKESEI